MTLRSNCLERSVNETSNAPGDQYDKDQHEHRTERANDKSDVKDEISEVGIDTIPIGTIVNDRWEVVSKLGEGGFGAVYKVTDCTAPVLRNSTVPQLAAMKVEIAAKACDKVLKLETAILRRMQGKRHFCRFLGCGQFGSYKFVMMTLLGDDLRKLRHAMPSSRFTLSTALRVSQQCISALEALHCMGFIHRDVKPSNVSIGSMDRRTMFLYDFGLSRRFVHNSGQQRAARRSCAFRGTVRYASVNALDYKDIGRCDDMWSLFYMLVELIVGRLPWRHLERKKDNLEAKRSTTVSQLLQDCPEELHMIYKHLRSLCYYDKPDYRLLSAILQRIMDRRDIDQWEPYDWERICDGSFTHGWVVDASTVNGCDASKLRALSSPS